MPRISFFSIVWWLSIFWRGLAGSGPHHVVRKVRIFICLFWVEYAGRFCVALGPLLLTTVITLLWPSSTRPSLSSHCHIRNHSLLCYQYFSGWGSLSFQRVIVYGKSVAACSGAFVGGTCFLPVFADGVYGLKNICLRGPKVDEISSDILRAQATRSSFNAGVMTVPAEWVIGRKGMHEP